MKIALQTPLSARQILLVTSTAMSILFAGIPLSFSQETIPVPDANLPQSLEAGHFEAVLGNSPFLRTLSLTETFALRGIAEIDGEKIATLYNRDTKKSVLVSAVKANAEQMKLVGVNDSDALNSVSATVAFSGEEVDLKFEPERVAPKPKGSGSHGPSPGSGDKGDGSHRRGPSKEDIERYKSLNEAQQTKFREYIRQTMQKYPDMSREERGNLIRGALTRLSEGGEIPGSSNSDRTNSNGGDRSRGGGDDQRSSRSGSQRR